jgi:fermentation-respiration switch protein FrsA (DUF1100 family)
VIGSKEVVNEAYASARELFAPRSKDGARRLQGSGKPVAGILWSLRDLRVRGSQLEIQLPARILVSMSMSGFRRRLSLVMFALAAVCDAQTVAEEIWKIARSQPSDEVARYARGLAGPDGGNKLFYFPTWDEPSNPAKWGHRYENVEFPSHDGTKLHGWFIPPSKGKPKGTVVFSHGNAGSMGHHLGFVLWLANAGYQVLMYDYRGFGKSGGAVDRRGMIHDVRAAFTYAQSRKDVSARQLISYGHSLGGAKSVTALAETPVPGLKAVVVEGAFASYQSMATMLAGALGKSLVTDDFSPRDYVGRLAPVPLLVIHGTADEIVPFSQGRELYERAEKPKTLFQVKNGRHGDSLSRQQGEYRNRMLEWLARL